ncbi:hypothetical protein JTB14_023908 [Gonioctena quinquepunctata]|nr:hypothetical protein JTB14_023908 [Gonioctena quinquepunctata]
MSASDHFRSQRKEAWGEDLKNTVCVDQDENDPENGESENSVTKDKLLEIDTQNDKRSSAIIYVNSEQPSTSQEITPIKIISNILIQKTNEKKLPSPSEPPSGEPTTSQKKTHSEIISDDLSQKKIKLYHLLSREHLYGQSRSQPKIESSKRRNSSVVSSKAGQDYHESEGGKKREEEEQNIKRAE